MVDTLNFGPANEKEGLKVDLACGTVLRDGYIGIDAADFSEEYGDRFIRHNLLEFPWPLKDGEVAATYSAHFIEHVPHFHPNWGFDRDGWWVFFEELYRVLEDGGIAEFIHPFSRSDRAFWDPTHVRFIHYQTWFYLNKEHRIQLGVNHYAPDIDFEIVSIQTMNEPQLLQGRSETNLEYARSFYFNVAEDLFVVLKAVKS